MEIQILDRNDPFFGGFPSADSIAEPKVAIYHLTTMTGWYYLPFEEKPETSDWWKMDHTKRAQLHGPDMIFDVEVTEAENGIDVHIVNTGIDRAPLRVELAFDAGCRVETEHFAADGAEEMCIRDRGRRHRPVSG